MALLGLDSAPKQLLFGSYLTLWIAFGLLAYNATQVQKVEFNFTAAVTVTNMLKLISATVMYLQQDGDLKSLRRDIRGNMKVGLGYIVPALVYAIYDNLAYINTSLMDPATYSMLLQFRLVVIGVLFQWMFRKMLTKRQWYALLIITIGCIIKEGGKSLSSSEESRSSYLGYVLLSAQILATAFGSVYTEALLKKVDCPFNLQNIFMYANSIFINSLVLMIRQGGVGILTAESFLPLLSPYVLPLVLIMSTVGIVTSLLLKHLDSVVKVIGSSLELVLLPIFQFLLFGINLDVGVVIAAPVIAVGVYLYSVKPVQTEKCSHLDMEEGVPLTQKEGCCEEVKNILNVSVNSSSFVAETSEVARKVYSTSWYSRLLLPFQLVVGGRRFRAAAAN